MTEYTENVQNCPACQAPMDTSAMEPLAHVTCPTCGELVVVSPQIAHYELIEVVGRGGMGVVYKARDLSLDREIALKVLRKDHSQNAELVAQLETEAAITASINHPYVVRVFTTGTDQGRFFIAMELVNKGTLDDLISLQGRVAEAQVLEIAAQIAQGLRAAYQHGLIHRDVKPGNILFADAHTAKIVDFGLAMLEEAAAGGGEIWGTPYYVAPEKLDQKPEDFRSDMYSLGATLFHALAGRPPFEAEDATMVALKHLKSQAVSLQAFAPHVSGSTAYVINRTLLKDPDQRYQSYDEFIEHLEYARTELEQKGTQTLTKKRVVLETEEDQKLWSYVTFGMLGLAVVLGAGGWWYVSSRKEAPAPVTGPSAALAVSSGADARQTKQYQSARQLLLNGKPAEAAKIFQTLGSDSKTPAPLAQWSLAHAGLAELLAGRVDEARVLYTALESRPMPTAGTQDAELAAFFKDLAAKMSVDGPVPASAAKDFPRENFGAFAPLAFGLKNWQLAQFEDAGALLRQYQTASPRGEYSWIGDYATLASDYLADFTEYRGALELVKMVKTDADERKTAERLKEMSAKLRTKGKLSERFDQLAENFKADRETRRKELVAKAAADRETLKKLLPRITELSRAWKFTDARQELSSLQITSNEVRGELYGLLQKLEWLDNWKSALIAELPKAGSKSGLRRKDGAELKGNVTKATETGIEVQGSGSVTWADIAPDSLLAAASSIAPANGSPEVLAQRSWNAGVFAAMNGDQAQAEKLLFSAAKARPELAGALPLLFNSLRPAEENLAKGAKVTASSYIQTSQFDERPEKVLDGNPKTKWCSRDEKRWIQLDLGAPKKIVGWNVYHASYGGEAPAMNTADFELQTSSDGQKWEPVDKVWGNTAAVTKRLIAPINTRYIRLNILKANNGSNDAAARIPEFALVGPVGSGPDDLAKSFFEPTSWSGTPQLVSHDNKTNALGSCEIDRHTGEVTVRGAGNDIWMKEDGFQFAFQKLVGDGQIVARVLNVEATDEWAKAGLMFRESLGGGAKNVFFGTTPVGRVTTQQRPQTGADTSSSHRDGFPAPIWLKLVRQGDKFTGYVSTDGMKWQESRSLTLSMPADIRVGLAVSSHKHDTLCAASFEAVQITNTLLSNAAAATTGGPGGTKTADAPQPGKRTASLSATP